MVQSELDDWLPDPQVRTVHRRSARASDEALWAAASSVSLKDTGTLGRLVRWRIPDTPHDRTYRELLAHYPFTVLAEGERWSISGLCGKIWTLQRDYPRLAGADEFRAWDQAGTVKVLFAHWVADGEFVSEARVKPVDKRAALRLRAIWLAIGQWERLIGVEPLRLAARRAEQG